MGVTTANFQTSGYTPLAKEMLKMVERGDEIEGARRLGRGHTCTFLAVPPKRSLRFRRCLGNGGGVRYALAESLDFATPKICERNLLYRGSASAEPAW